MPAKSKKQQRLLGMAYSYAKNKNKNVSKSIKDIAKSFMKNGKRRGIKKLKDFASTKHDGLPIKIESFYQFNESLSYNNKEISEYEYKYSEVKMSKLSNIEINKLNELFKPYKSLYNISIEYQDNSNKINFIMKNKYYKNIYISKFDDDWFYLCEEILSTLEYLYKDEDRYKKLGIRRYWKCDQIDGLIVQLNEIMLSDSNKLKSVRSIKFF